MEREILIIQQVVGVFRLYGIRSLSLEEIAKLINLTSHTLRKYFRTKELLLLKCVTYRISQEEIFNNADECLPDMMVDFVEVYPELCGKLSRRCCLEIKKYYHDVFHFLDNFLDSYAVACRDKVEDAIVNGYVRPTVSPHLVYTFFSKHWSNLFMPDACSFSLSESLEITKRIQAFTRELVTIKGQIYINEKLKNRSYNEAD